MSQRNVYVSYVAEDEQTVRRLLNVLEVVGIGVITGKPDAIAGAGMFVACFSAAADGTPRYNRDELQRAIEHGRMVRGTAPWLTFAKLVPCAIPPFPGMEVPVAVFDLHGQWHESVARLIAPPAGTVSSASSSVKVDDAFAGEAEFTNVDHDGDARPGVSDARSEIAIKSLVVDRKLEFTNVRNRRL